MHITPVGSNIFVDLGFEPEEAARLHAETDQAISEKLSLFGAVRAVKANVLAIGF